MSLIPVYPAHQVFYEPAKRTAQLWRLVVGTGLAITLYLTLNIFYGQFIRDVIQHDVPDIFGQLDRGDTPLAMYLLLASFALMLISTVFVTRMLHHRSALSLLGPSDRFVPQFAAVTLALIALGIVLTLLPPWDMGGALVRNMDLGRWLLLLPLSLIVVLIQVSGEEVFFRGYLQQQLAARFQNPLAWMVLPSVVFGALHYDPATAGEHAAIIALWAVVFGMLMADLTARAGSLGPAIAVHFCNNVSAIVFISLPDNLSGLALYLAPFGMADTEAMRAWLPVDFALILVTWLAARLALRR